MRTRRYVSLIIAIVMLTTIFMGVTFPTIVDAAGNTYYVSISKGDDGNNGTSASTPFKTIGKAASIMTAGDACYIMEGVYPEEVIPANSGADGSPITFKNYNNEKVTVSGSDPVTGWVKAEEFTEINVYKAYVENFLDQSQPNGPPAPPSDTTGLHIITRDNGPAAPTQGKGMVFVGGEWMFEARWPNNVSGQMMMTSQDYATAGTGTSQPSAGSGNPAALIATVGNPSFPDSWTTSDLNGAAVWVLGTQATSTSGKWTWFAEPVTKNTYNPSNKTFQYRGLKIRDNGTQVSGYYYMRTGNAFYLVGAKALLDAEKEWWYDPESKYLYLCAPGQIDANTVYAEARTREYAFNLSGKSNIVIDGINILGATVMTDDNSTNNLLKNMNCQYVSYYKYHDWTLDDTIYMDHAELGIVLNGKNNEINSCEIAYSSGALVSIRGVGNKLINSYVHDGNLAGTYAGHTDMAGRDSIVSHNTLANSGRDVVSFRRAKGGTLQYNDIYGAGYLTQDVGIVYAANADTQFFQIHHNYVHDNYSTAARSGIYPDEMTHNTIIYNNTIWDTAQTTGHPGTICLNQPSFFNLVYNNTGYSNSIVGANYFDGTTFSSDRGNHWVNNLFGAWKVYAEGGSGRSGFMRNNSVTLTSSAGTQGVTTNPIASDFINAAGKDFRLATETYKATGWNIAGVTDEAGSSPNMGAYPSSNMYRVGHDFNNPPVTPSIPDISIFEFRNQIKNGGFEYGTFESWSVNGNTELKNLTSWHKRDSTSATGFYGVQFNDVGDSVSQTVTGLKPNTNYNASALFRCESSNELAELSVTGYGGEALSATTNANGTTATAGWGSGTVTVSFTTGANDTSATITARKATGSGFVLVDDIGVQKHYIGNKLLSQEITQQKTGTVDNVKLLFNELPTGHSYYYSSVQTNPYQDLSDYIVGTYRPSTYRYKLNSGDVLVREKTKYINIVEVDSNDVIVGYASIISEADSTYVTVNPSQSTYTDQKTPDTAIGSQKMVKVHNAANAVVAGYLQFDFSDLEISDANEITTAKLRLYVSGINNPTGQTANSFIMQALGIQNSSENWDISSITHNSLPTLTSTTALASATAYTYNGPGWYEFDVTDYIKTNNKHSNDIAPGKVSFRIQSSAANGSLYYYIQANDPANPAYNAQLNITLVDSRAQLLSKLVEHETYLLDFNDLESDISQNFINLLNDYRTLVTNARDAYNKASTIKAEEAINKLDDARNTFETGISVVDILSLTMNSTEYATIDDIVPVSLYSSLSNRRTERLYDVIKDVIESGVYASDISIKYDPNKLEFVNISKGLELFDVINDPSAGALTLVASGSAISITTKTDAKIADSSGYETEPNCEFAVLNFKVKMGESGIVNMTGANLYDDNAKGRNYVNPASLTISINYPSSDKNELIAKIAEADKLVNSIYTPETWIILEKALTDADKVVNDLWATQSVVDGALQKLTEAIEQLILKKYIESIQSVEVTTEEGIPPVLPNVVTVVYNYGDNEELPVTWETVTEDKYASPGSFIVAGAVTGTDIAAKATVTVTAKPIEPEIPVTPQQPTPPSYDSGSSSSGSQDPSPAPTSPPAPKPTETALDKEVVNQLNNTGDATTIKSTTPIVTLTEETFTKQAESKKDLSMIIGNVELKIAASEVASISNKTQTGSKVVITVEESDKKPAGNFSDMSKTLLELSRTISVAVDGVEVKNYIEPITMVFPVKGYNMTQFQKDKLTGICIAQDGSYRILGGKINANGDFEVKTHTINANEVFSLIIASNLTKISMSLDNDNFTVNNSAKKSDVPPIIVDGRTMVPVRFIAESMGASVNWNEAQQKVTITLDGQTIELIIGAKDPGMDVAAFIKDGRTMVPVRYVSEKFKANVLYDSKTKEIDIYR